MPLRPSQTALSQMKGRLRRRQPLCRNRRGVGGFFEEIPAFIVVVIAVALFMTAAYSSYITYSQQSASDELFEDCYRFSRAFRSYDAIVEKGVIFQEPHAGHLDADKLDVLNTTDLSAGLNCPHHFNITVKDRIAGRAWTLGDRPPSGGVSKAGVSSAVLISEPDGRLNPGSVSVVMWE